MPVTLFDRDGKPLNATFLPFSGGERHVQLGELKEDVRFIIRADLRGADDILDLLLMTDALSRQCDEPALHVEVPYLPYARQDRVCAPGQAFSMEVMAGLFSQIKNVAELVVWDCHSPVGVTLTDAINVPATDIIRTSHALSEQIVDLGSVLICPDKGAIERTQEIAQTFQKDLQPEPIIYCDKVRDSVTGQITQMQVGVESLEGRTAIITDDICDGGYTFIKIAEQLKAKGAERVILFVTHGIFSKGMDVFEGLIDHVFTTDSFEHDADPRLTVIPFQYPFFAD